MRRHAIQKVQLSSVSGVICTEMVRKLFVAGYTFAEVPINHYPREYGLSQFFTLRSVTHTTYDFFCLWWRIVVMRRLFPTIHALHDRNAQNPLLAEQAVPSE
jgi:hypothetical protein